MMNKQLLSTTGLVLAIILFIAFNVVVNGNFKSLRVDLTQDNLYTLSQGSLNIIAALPDTLTLQLYFSNKVAQELPGLKSYAQRVQELLAEYQRRSNGKIRLKIINPKPFSDDEQRARRYGLQAIPIEGETDPLYFGLVGTNLLDGIDVITFFQPEKEEALEHDITKLVYTLSSASRKSVGILSALAIDGDNYDPIKGLSAPQGDASVPWAFMAELRQLFNVTTLPNTIGRIPSSLDVLIVVHPKAFADSTLYAIDQYVLRGGKLISFVDPYAESDVPEQDPNNPMAAMVYSRSSNMPDLFKAWGVERAASDVVADRKTAIKVDFGARVSNKPIDYVLWQAIGADQLNKQQALTRQLKRIEVATPGYFKHLEGATTTFLPLISSSNEAMLVDKRVVQFRNDPLALLTKYQSGTLTYPIAARVTGAVKSAFPDGLKDKPAAKHLTQSSQDIDVIVVADVDMLQDKFWVQVQDFYDQKISYSTSNNIDFLINAIDDMSGEKGLISVRSRGEFSRPFDRVVALTRQAEKRYRTQERALQKTLDEAKQRIARMQAERSGSADRLLNADQEKEIAQFRMTIDKTTQKLRDVQGKLRQDIDRLDAQLKFFNIGLVPIMIALLAIFVSGLRMNKRGRKRVPQA